MREPIKGLTSTQREALEWLRSMRERAGDRQAYGFNPPHGNPRLASSMRRALAERGFVDVQRVAVGHNRYEITEAGRAALNEARND